MTVKSCKVQSRIQKELLEQVKIKASYSGLSVSFIIRALLKMWIDGKVEIRV